MDRSEFCKMLVEARESKQISKCALCRTTGYMLHELRRIEKAQNNFKMDLIFQYLQGINNTLSVINAGTMTQIKDYETLYSWIVNVRKQSDFNTVQLADALGLTRVSISNIENKRQKITIDYFLSLCTLLKYDVIIK